MFLSLEKSLRKEGYSFTHRIAWNEKEKYTIGLLDAQNSV